MVYSREGGQALLLILLTMTTTLIVGLSVVSKSISDISLSTAEEESLRAFSAAEAGVEEALIGLPPGGTTVSGTPGEPGQSEFDAQVSDYGNTTGFNYPKEIVSGDSATLWFMEHDIDGNLTCPCFTRSNVTLYWGRGGSAAPAIEVAVYYEESGEIRVARAAYDPVSGRRSSNNFESASGGTTFNDVAYAAQRTVSFGDLGIPYATAGSLKFMKVRFLYNSTPQIIAASGGGTSLPSQGRHIDSRGVSGESTRRVEVFALHPDVPGVFDTALFSEGGIVKP